MSPTNTPDPAFEVLDNCDAVLAKLDALCCEPDRSPRMKALGETLAQVRSGVAGFGVGNADQTPLLDALADAGSQIGWLQVGCCTPKRMPLYETLLEGLNEIQRTVSESIGQGH